MLASYPNLRIEIERFLEKFNHEIPHVRHVQWLSGVLFDSLAAGRGFEPRHRALLESAALLHDIGWVISEKKHHKHSMRLILNHPFGELGERERLIVANIARYHRRAMPKNTHDEYIRLAPEDRDLTRKLAAILRIADALDKGHNRNIVDVSAGETGDGFTIHARSAEPCAREYRAFHRKKRLFYLAFGIPVHMEAEVLERGAAPMAV